MVVILTRIIVIGSMLGVVRRLSSGTDTNRLLPVEILDQLLITRLDEVSSHPGHSYDSSMLCCCGCAECFALAVPIHCSPQVTELFSSSKVIIFILSRRILQG